MVALAANRAGTYFQAVGPITSHIVSMPVEAGEHIFRGALVGRVAGSGGLQPMADTASMQFAGIALEEVDNTGGADGALVCEVYTGPALILLATALSLTIADVGTLFHAL